MSPSHFQDAAIELQHEAKLIPILHQIASFRIFRGRRKAPLGFPVTDGSGGGGYGRLLLAWRASRRHHTLCRSNTAGTVFGADIELFDTCPDRRARRHRDLR